MMEAAPRGGLNVRQCRESRERKPRIEELEVVEKCRAFKPGLGYMSCLADEMELKMSI
jgi:hypothetical protein